MTKEHCAENLKKRADFKKSGHASFQIIPEGGKIIIDCLDYANGRDGPGTIYTEGLPEGVLESVIEQASKLMLACGDEGISFPPCFKGRAKYSTGYAGW